MAIDVNMLVDVMLGYLDILDIAAWLAAAPCIQMRFGKGVWYCDILGYWLPSGFPHYYYFCVPLLAKIPSVKNIKLKSSLEWLTFGVILIDKSASESDLIEVLD